MPKTIHTLDLLLNVPILGNVLSPTISLES
jgi:hypothetical protein